MNAAEQYAAFRRRIDRKHSLVDNPTYPLSWFLAQAFEAEQEVNARRRLLKTSYDRAIVSGQLRYALPPDYLDGLSDFGIEIVSGTTEPVRPAERSEDEVRAQNSGFVNPVTGTPLHWFWSGSQIGIYPPAASGTLRLHYIKKPAALDPVTAIYDGESVGATFTLSDETVTPGSAAVIPVGQFTADGSWHIGRGTMASPPTAWRKIAAVTDDGTWITSLEMETAWDQPTAAGASFIVAKVSPLSVEFPELSAGMAPVYYALRELEDAYPDPSGVSYVQLYGNAAMTMGRAAPEIRQMRSSLGGALGTQ